MRRTLQLGLMCVGLTAAAALWPSEAEAQRRSARVRPPARAVAIARPRTYRPVYRHYRPSFYGGFFWQRYPYPYPYPYYGYRYDDRAEIRVDVRTKDAEVYVDGYFAGVVDDFDGFGQRLRVEPGDHEITIYHPAFQTWQEQVRLRPRQSLTIPPVLQPLAPGAQPEPRPIPQDQPVSPERGERRPIQAEPPAGQADLGTLAIRVQPLDAEVWIDGERWDWPAGESRLLVDVPAGSHRVEVRRAGHQAYAATIDVRRGETAQLNVSLRRDR